MATNPATPASGINFDLDKAHADALQAIAGKRSVRLSGRVEKGKLVVDFVACNAPFLACNAAFTAVNAPFKKD
jgi:hypothetical protein